MMADISEMKLVSKIRIQGAERYPENLSDTLPKYLGYCLYCNKSMK